MIDFKKLSSQVKATKTSHPSEIFTALPTKIKKYDYLRNVQSEVLEEWYSSRNEKDLIIKMNTGSGKTTVALLILKSCIVENAGKAVYIVPDKYLVRQVISEAKNLGISVTDDPEDIDFLCGKSIFVTTIQKLVNGKSIFGMRASGNITIDYLIIDDVHACVDTVESQCHIKLDIGGAIGQEVFNLFKDDLKEQNEKKYLDLIDGDCIIGGMVVPFWKVNDRKSCLLEIFQKYKSEDELLFSYPLLGDIIEYCDIVITSKLIEISPYALPIHKITGFTNARRRIFMSATLCDDSFLISDFNLSSNIKLITPKRASDIGDRLILCPQVINANISELEIKNKILNLSKNYNVVVIVPSKYRSRFWSDVTNNIYESQNILSGIEKIKSQSEGLYVFINKYDGIDLPDDACRLIVLDGLPDARSAIGRINEQYLAGSNDSLKNKIQKIEQGMGRGIRSSNDYCGIVIMGSNLVKVLFNNESNKYFSEATKRQVEVSFSLIEDLKNQPIDNIFKVLDYCINEDPNWVEISKEAVSDLMYKKELNIDKTVMINRVAFNECVLKGKNYTACNKISELINATDDNIKKGYLMLLLAKYKQFTDSLEAQQILLSAQEYNSNIIKPIGGIQKYRNLNRIKPQAQQIMDSFLEKGENSYIIEMNSAISNLVFAPDSYLEFEEGMKSLGNLLGFNASRPDNEYGVGPDDLWYVGDGKYFVIECKNEAINPIISKDYCSQLLHSLSWFDTEYEVDSKRVPIMIYPTNNFEKNASPAEDFRVIDDEKLKLLKKRIDEYCKTISSDGNFKNLTKLSTVLIKFNFTPDKFIKEYTKTFNKIKI